MPNLALANGGFTPGRLHTDDGCLIINRADRTARLPQGCVKLKRVIGILIAAPDKRSINFAGKLVSGFVKLINGFVEAFTVHVLIPPEKVL
jgi:hypothetical protein